MCDQKMKLADALDSCDTILEKARVLIDEICSGFFDSFDPKEARDLPLMGHAFTKHRVLASLLVDQLAALDNDLPRSDWLDTVNITKAAEPQKKGA